MAVVAPAAAAVVVAVAVVVTALARVVVAVVAEVVAATVEAGVLVAIFSAGAAGVKVAFVALTVMSTRFSVVVAVSPDPVFPHFFASDVVVVVVVVVFVFVVVAVHLPPSLSFPPQFPSPFLSQSTHKVVRCTQVDPDCASPRVEGHLEAIHSQVGLNKKDGIQDFITTLYR